MNAPREPVIIGVEITAGHDGQADLVFRVRHENGVVSPIVLDGDASFSLMEADASGDVSSLVGRPWREVLARSVLAAGEQDERPSGRVKSCSMC